MGGVPEVRNDTLTTLTVRRGQPLFQILIGLICVQETANILVVVLLASLLFGIELNFCQISREHCSEYQPVFVSLRGNESEGNLIRNQ